MSALGLQKLTGPLPKLNCPTSIQKLRDLQIYASDIGDDVTDVGLLIGADVYGYLLSGNVVHVHGGLYAVETKLGWSLQGVIPSNFLNVSNYISVNFNKTDYWELETLGIKSPCDKMSIEKEINTCQFFRETVTINQEGRYEISLPWREGFPEEFGDNSKSISLKRLYSTTKRLVSLNYLCKYNQVFKDWITEGIIEEVPGNKNGLYLPHHAVIKESSATTPIRPVFDTSAKDSFGNSLNSSLEKGKNLLEIIPKIIIDFRLQEIGITADIRKAFLQISVKADDRDYLQFLWWRDINNRKDLVTYRHKRVVFGVTCSPFLLAATINYHLDKVVDDRKPIAQKLKASFYVDNCVTSVGSKDECKYFIDTAKQLMDEGKFDLRGWVTGPSEESNVLSVLGFIWETKADTLRTNLKFNDINKENLTKRLLLSYSNSIFDPIGFTSPVSLLPKLLLQRSWLLNLDWDDQLPTDICSEFIQWLDKIEHINEIHLPRRLTVHNVKYCKNTIHVFCDASKHAYATCIYLRSEFENNVHIQLVLAKSRVAPVKELSLPRLELMAAVIGVRLYELIKHSFEVHNIHVDTVFWSDSSVVLTWIKNDGNWPVFVKNRVKEIRQVSLSSQWRYVPGSLNPADLHSRGCDAMQLRNSRWWEGPQWLNEDPSCWPSTPFDFIGTQSLSTTPATMSTVCENFSNAFSYFSKYPKIIRTCAWLFRFIHNCKNKINKRTEDINFQEYTCAENIIFLILQREYSADVKRKYNLELFLDKNGLLRVQTRLVLNTMESENFKYPILLPGNSKIVQKLINYKHCSLQHAGTGTLLSNLREQYWILNARRWVKKFVSDCPLCRRFKCKAATAPEASLPENRTKTSKAFQVTGIDLCGPLILKCGSKVWIVLFTCAVYRGVHLELVESLSTEAFIMSLRRFVARRGRVSVIYTDNGTNFVGTNNLLKAVNWDKIQQFSTVKGIEWKFNAPSSPWWGGFWERLVRTLKEMLRRMLGRSSLNYVELETLLCDCESTINSRPLTFMADDTERLQPLTPNSFMQDLSETEVPDLDQVDAAEINKRYRYIQKMRSDFRSRFRSEYLGGLVQKPHKFFANNLKQGDVVLLDTDNKRHLWPLAVVLECMKGRDGNVRSVKLKTDRGSILVRPIQKLYPLEVQDALTP